MWNRAEGAAKNHTEPRRFTDLTSTSHVIAPHGGELINLIVEPGRAAELKGHSKEWPSWDLTARQVCDVELLLSGGFSPSTRIHESRRF